jgi:hypothetical protein
MAMSEEREENLNAPKLEGGAALKTWAPPFYFDKAQWETSAAAQKNSSTGTAVNPVQRSCQENRKHQTSYPNETCQWLQTKVTNQAEQSREQTRAEQRLFAF